MKSTSTYYTRIIALSLIISVFILISCNKKPARIGDGIQPDQNLLSVSFSDATNIVAYSSIEDSIRTDATTEMLLGSIADPTFGTSVAGFYTQFRLSTNGHTFGDNPVADSMVLRLAYKTAYGDTLTQQTVHVYELLEDLFVDSSYYSNSVKQTSATDLANFSFKPEPNTPFAYDGDTLPMICLKLSDISTGLMDRLIHADSTDLDSNVSFQKFFKGLYIVADPVASGGAVSYFSLTSTNSFLTLYYKNDEEDSLSYTFFVTSNDEHYNVFNHNNYQNADPAFIGQVVQKDTLLGTSKLYMEGMGGVKTRIRFPNLADYPEFAGKKVVINEAKLFLTGVETPTVYSAPSQLALVNDDGDGTYSVLDDQLEGSSYFGGTYKSSVNEYQFRLTRYIQDMLLNGKGRDDHGLLLFIIGASGKADRWVFNGTNPSEDTLKPLRLQVVYSVLNE
ncbi:MAG: DUF4270 domain-containing protein [Bacteroidales bacterium]|nr:DUF4270 domain-containing protein [Bacteroidales bacterium]